jgi:hypothetical protein
MGMNGKVVLDEWPANNINAQYGKWGSRKTHAMLREEEFKALLAIPVRFGRRATLLNTSGVRGIVTNLHKGF